MICKDEGIVLKTARSGETSKLVTFLGREGGKFRLVAKGALKGQSPFRGTVEPGNYLEILYYFREGRARRYLRETHVRSSLDTHRDSLAKMALALAALELVDDVCYWESPEPRVVDLVHEYLRHPDPADPVLFFLAFEIGLLAVLGALPDFTACAVCGSGAEGGHYYPEQGASACRAHGAPSARRIALDAGATAVVSAIAGKALARSARLTAAPSARKRLGSLIHWTYTYHVENYRLPESLRLLPKDIERREVAGDESGEASGDEKE
jgi:DNA repair protein RecO (recombination protein O)